MSPYEFSLNCAGKVFALSSIATLERDALELGARTHAPPFQFLANSL